MVSVCRPSDALSQHLPSHLGFSYLRRGVSLHGCSSKAQPVLLTLDEVTPPDLEHGVAPLGHVSNIFDPMYCRAPGSSVHGTLQAKILEWVAISFSRATVHMVAKSRTRLSNFTFTFHFHASEKEMATYSSFLAWRILGTEETGGLPTMGSYKFGHYWSDLAAATEGWITGQLQEKEDLRLFPFHIHMVIIYPNKARQSKRKSSFSKTNLCLRLCGGKPFIS